jgi:hypothetical protein
MRLAIEQGCPMSREQAVAFLNQEGHAYEMWKQMMRAGEEFIAGSLLRHGIVPACTSDVVSVHTLMDVTDRPSTLVPLAPKKRVHEYQF